MNPKALYKILLLLICPLCNAQTSDFVVTASHDTIVADKINLTDFDVKIKRADKKQKFKVEEIISYYSSKDNKYYDRVENERKTVQQPDKYDYRRNDDFHLEEYEKRVKYRFIQRLTVGKVRIYFENLTITVAAPDMPEIRGASSFPFGPEKNETYYIAIDNSKLELISSYGKLKLTDDVYDVLTEYLYGNDKIIKKLNHLHSTGKLANEEQIIALVNEYNIWVALNK
ncbi:MAG: hypothetical protein EOO48_01495 [Flavobacterium sp.]|nr:MAG: hypothetical protein EOO48_01495 [Flavobacterium sp.]